MSFLYAFSGYADEATAKTALSEFVVGSTWRTDKVVANTTITGKTGFCCSVTVPAARDDLYSITECQFELNLAAKVVNRTKIPYRTIETTHLGRGPQRGVYHSWRSTGMVNARPMAASSAWPYLTVNDVGQALHPNSANFTATFLDQLGEAAFAVNGMGGPGGGGPGNGGGSYTLPTYVAEPDTPRIDVTPSNNDPHPYYSGAAGVEFETEICADVPIPVGATQAGGTDRQMGFYDPETDTSWQFWIWRESPYRANRGGRRVDVDTWDCRYVPNTWGVAATALPMEQHIFTVDEMEMADYAPHAIGFALIRAQAAVVSWPAGRSDGATNTQTTPHQIPEGARFRLKASTDLDALDLHPIMRFIGKTLQVHGGIITDRAGSVGANAENEKPYILQGLAERWPAIMDGTAFYQFDTNFPWEDIEWLPQEFGRPGDRPGHIPGLKHWFSCQNVGDLLTNSGQSFQPMTGAYDISSCSVELRVPTTVPANSEAPDYWSNGWPNKTLPSARFTRANNERLITTGAERLQLGASCTTFAMCAVFSPRTAFSANARIMSIRATGQTNDDDNDGSAYFGINAAGTHYIWKNNATEIELAAVGSLNTDAYALVVCDGTEAHPFFATVAGGFVTGTPVACTSTFGDVDGEADITYGNIYQGGQAWEGAIPCGLVWNTDEPLNYLTKLRGYLNVWLTT